MPKALNTTTLVLNAPNLKFKSESLPCLAGLGFIVLAL